MAGSLTTVVDVSTSVDLLLPDPEPREVRYTIISVDDHLVEPPGMFEGRLARRLQADAPKVVRAEDGNEAWAFEGQVYSQIGLNAIAGRRKDTWNREPARFSDMRPGCWDIDARIADMDINGVWASLNFPSQIAGFCGKTFSAAKDPELGFAVTRAWNDWLYEEWYSPYPDRIVPMGITWLADAELGANEIRRNAARGFTAVSLPERPQHIGYPALNGGYWDPIIKACAETDTVICLHVASTGGHPDISNEVRNYPLRATLFGELSLIACAEWLWSQYPVRYPSLKIAMSEGGIGWVAMMLDRLDSITDRADMGLMPDNADIRDRSGLPFPEGFDPVTGLRPAEVLKRNFWFCTIDDPSTIDTRDRIGTENIMLEVDYPHSDSTWPDTQEIIAKAWGHLPLEDLRKMTHLNAAHLFRQPLPPRCLP